MRSDIAYNVHNFAHEKRTMEIPAGAEVPDNMFAEYTNAPDALNIIFKPEGATWDKEEPLLLGAQVYEHLGSLENKLNAEYPLALRGLMGPSGREGDRASSAGLSLYDCAIENNNQLWAGVINMGMKICSKVPDMIPEGLKKGDVDSYYEITVNLRKDDPFESARKSAEGDKKYQMGIIDLEELYTEYMGKTQDEAKKLKAKVWIEQRIRTSPFLGQIIDEAVAENLGQRDRLEQLRQMIKGETAGVNPIPQIGSEGGEQRLGNIQTELGGEMADQSIRHETRLSPTGV